MSKTIDTILLKLQNRYVVLNHVKEISLGYRIGLGKIIRVYGNPTDEVVKSIELDARPYVVFIYN